jgi:hypothetical protein
MCLFSTSLDYKFPFKLIPWKFISPAWEALEALIFTSNAERLTSEK